MLRTVSEEAEGVAIDVEVDKMPPLPTPAWQSFTQAIDHLQPSLAMFIRRRPQPASVIASLRSNKRLRKLD